MLDPLFKGKPVRIIRFFDARNDEVVHCFSFKNLITIGSGKAATFQTDLSSFVWEHVRFNMDRLTMDVLGPDVFVDERRIGIGETVKLTSRSIVRMRDLCVCVANTLDDRYAIDEHFSNEARKMGQPVNKMVEPCEECVLRCNEEQFDRMYEGMVGKIAELKSVKPILPETTLDSMIESIVIDDIKMCLGTQLDKDEPTMEQVEKAVDRRLENVNEEIKEVINENMDTTVSGPKANKKDLGMVVAENDMLKSVKAQIRRERRKRNVNLSEGDGKSEGDDKGERGKVSEKGKGTEGNKGERGKVSEGDGKGERGKVSEKVKASEGNKSERGKSSERSKRSEEKKTGVEKAKKTREVEKLLSSEGESVKRKSSEGESVKRKSSEGESVKRKSSEKKKKSEQVEKDKKREKKKELKTRPTRKAAVRAQNESPKKRGQSKK